MKNFTKSNLIKDDHFEKQLIRFSVCTSSELNLSAILAGFSLGAVVALLFMDKSELVRWMFLLSIIASILFLLSTVYHQFIFNNVEATKLYLENFSTSEEKYLHVRKINSHSNSSTNLFKAGLMAFSLVIIFAGFMFSFFAGVLISAFYIPSLIIIFRKGNSLFDKMDILDYDLDFEKIPD